MRPKPDTDSHAVIEPSFNTTSPNQAKQPHLPNNPPDLSAAWP